MTSKLFILPNFLLSLSISFADSPFPLWPLSVVFLYGVQFSPLWISYLSLGSSFHSHASTKYKYLHCKYKSLALTSFTSTRLAFLRTCHTFQLCLHGYLRFNILKNKLIAYNLCAYEHYYTSFCSNMKQRIFLIFLPLPDLHIHLFSIPSFPSSVYFANLLSPHSHCYHADCDDHHLWLNCSSYSG